MAQVLTLATLVTKLTADATEYDKTIGKKQREAKGIGGKLGGALALGAAGALAGVAVQVGQFTDQAIKDFRNFEDATNEVFTLMPGISEQAMGQMRSQILEAGVDMGRLTEETVPALYQSLSAGVPSDNVFEFLEQAHLTALGGVTDLTTAVDVLTTVTNSYGAENISAAEASDLLFTAVKGGKTTMDELGKFLFNVIPIAASVGLEFSNVTAAMEAMTSQGVPTRQAVTQLRQLLVELSKDGTEASDAFKEAAGVGLVEFLNRGNDLADVLVVMEGAAADNNVAINDLFGSVEAGQGALVLTNENLGKLVTALENAEGAFGATQEAADRMNESGARLTEQIAALKQEISVTTGEVLGGGEGFQQLEFSALSLLGALPSKVRNIQLVTEALGDFKEEVDISENIEGISGLPLLLRDIATVQEDGMRVARDRADLDFLILDIQNQLADGMNRSRQELLATAEANLAARDGQAAYEAALAAGTEALERSRAAQEKAKRSQEGAIQFDREAVQTKEELAAEMMRAGDQIDAAARKEMEAFLAAKEVTDAAAESARVLGIETANYFTAALGAEEATASLAEQFFEKVAAEDEDIEKTIALARETGLFTEEEIAAAAAAAETELATDALAEAFVEGEITAKQAAAAVKQIEEGNIAAAERTVGFKLRVDELKTSLDKIPGEYVATVRVRVIADPIPSGAAAAGVPTGHVGHAEGQTGLDMIVPPGFNRDNFLIGTTTGERVIVIPEADRMTRGDTIFNIDARGAVAGVDGQIADAITELGFRADAIRRRGV